MRGTGTRLIVAVAALFMVVGGAFAEITQFTVTDQSSGSALFTNQPPVNVSITTDAPVVAYAFSPRVGSRLPASGETLHPPRSRLRTQPQATIPFTPG